MSVFTLLIGINNSNAATEANLTINGEIPETLEIDIAGPAGGVGSASYTAELGNMGAGFTSSTVATIGVKSNVESGFSVIVNSTSGFMLTSGTNSIPYQLAIGGSGPLVSGTGVAVVAEDSITGSDPRYNVDMTLSASDAASAKAGSYTDSVVFSLELGE